ncbi:MAG: hypothetical protein ACE1Y4_05980 [Lysobacterales bacterium]
MCCITGQAIQARRWENAFPSASHGILIGQVIEHIGRSRVPQGPTANCTPANVNLLDKVGDRRLGETGDIGANKPNIYTARSLNKISSTRCLENIKVLPNQAIDLLNKGPS